MKFNIHDYAKTNNGTVQFPFSYDKDRVVAALRKFADLVESDDLVLQNIKQTTHISVDNFMMQTFVCEYVEKLDVVKKAASAATGQATGAVKLPNAFD